MLVVVLDILLSVKQKRCLQKGDLSGAEFISHTGLPKGSVLSPILFNIFTIMDMFEEVEGDFTKIADGGRVWHNGKNITELAEKVAADVKKGQHHCNT